MSEAKKYPEGILSRAQALELVGAKEPLPPEVAQRVRDALRLPSEMQGSSASSGGRLSKVEDLAADTAAASNLGKFTPVQRLLLTMGAGVLTAVGVALSGPVTVPLIIGAIVSGAGTGLVAWLGIGSAGVRR